ncbi:MAG TPA: glutathione-disulfide reductase [Cyanobacteria bacterium UBA11369]|nr:glutathione-disulfide reductase [Cyanobacteria bacterium UBA11371]HBE32615.1 glutathione-disulfide reductase [Cyanobacteria bacterium UBA11368]HBE53679.1 glutathione-disulfide reductase [Cyanobacteria bacterium UBA11369]
MKFDYDLFVIGAGPGGLAAAERAAGYGARVAIAEQDLVGGTCVIRGCIPEKLMSYAASFSELYQEGIGYGWKQPQTSFDWHQFMIAKNEEIRRLSDLHKRSLEKAGVEFIKGRATLINPHTLDIKPLQNSNSKTGETPIPQEFLEESIQGRQITAEKILIAVGGEAVKPQIPGIEYAITSRELFDRKQQPKHVAIIGGNYIAVKLAGIMRMLGSFVTLIVHEDGILSDFDADICRAVTEGIKRRGIQIINNSAVKKIEQIHGEQLHLTLSGTSRDTSIVDTVVCVTGRAPNLTGLNLEAAGVKVSKSRNCYVQVDAIAVDEQNQTTQANIFAVGDCTNRLTYTPVAIAQARAFADTHFGDRPQTISYECIPSVVSFFPEAATVGLSEEKAREKIGDFLRCDRSEFRPLFHSLAKREEKVLIKLVVDSTNERVLGVHMVGPGAIEIVQCLALPLRMGATKKDFDATIGIHPSVAEEFFALV